MRFRLHKLLAAPVGAQRTEMLETGRVVFDADLAVAYLRGSLVFTRLNEAIMVSGQIESATQVQCVRSLEHFELCPIVELQDVLFTLPGAPVDEPDRMVSDDGWIDLTETLREEILMAIPINPISPAHVHDDDEDTLPDGLDDSDREWLTVRLKSGQE
jgi:uncharacterized metal-binding protein YceD (DUF177 family)